ncbi:ubiquitin family protein [Ceratobasidium sp. AG-Ba]|nr:ubiquitin family protein [Ceratobasidium sp. AG-Ba]
MANNCGPYGGNQLPAITAIFMDRVCSIRRIEDYRLAMITVQYTFAKLRYLPLENIKITAYLPEYGDVVDITKDMWAEYMPGLTEITVVADLADLLTGHHSFFVKTLTGRTTRIDAELSDTIHSFKSKIYNQEGIPICEQRLICAGKQYEDHNTFAHYGVPFGATLYLCNRLRGGKPVVYLLPSIPMANIYVDLALTGDWSFSSVYPFAVIRPTVNGGQTIAWTVDAKPDGTLLEHGTGREVSYLFWEAHTNPVLPPSPDISRSGSPIREVAAGFNPSRPIVIPTNSVVLPFNKVTSYIDDVLLSLGLHTEARCSFITYWLPELQRHQHIALRFLPQSEYEVAAPMRINPTPDVTTRVFMLFRGVKQADLDFWAEAVKDVNEWGDIVGVDAQKATDTSIFRVLEWGGMELK